MLLASSHQGLVIAQGPTPHAVARMDVAATGPTGAATAWGSVPWSAGASAGSGRALLFRGSPGSDTPDVAVVDIQPDCSIAKVELLRSRERGVGARWVAAARVTERGKTHVQALLDSPIGGHLVTFMGAGEQTGAVAVNGADNAAECQWKALAAADMAAFGTTLIAARQCLSTVPRPTVFEVALNGSVTAQLNVTIHGHSDWAGVAVVDVEGDGNYRIALARHGGANATGPRGALLDWNRTSDATSKTAIVLTTLVDFDGIEQQWLSFGASSWLGTSAMRRKDQLVALRAFRPALSGCAYAVNVLVYGSARFTIPRRVAMQDTLGQMWAGEQFLNYTTDVDGFNTTYFKQRLTETNTNVHQWFVHSLNIARS
eukprot:SAG31_NODE_5713_length_2368_cov_2.096518_2_plen_372_part_00